MSFSNLKKATGIESSGLLSFHLGKLTHLAGTTQDGTYGLTDQGKEALRMIHATRCEETEPTIRVRNPAKRRYITAIAVLLVCLVALGSFALYQQGVLTPSNHKDSAQAGPDTILYGAVGDRGTSWLAGFTATSLSSNLTFVSASGVTYTVQLNAAGQYWVSLPKNESYSVVGKWAVAVTCVESCKTLMNADTDTGTMVVSSNPITVTTTTPIPIAPSHCSPSGCFGLGTFNPSAATTMTGTGYCQGENVVLGSANSYNYTFSC